MCHVWRGTTIEHSLIFTDKCLGRTLQHNNSYWTKTLCSGYLATLGCVRATTNYTHNPKVPKSTKTTTFSLVLSKQPLELIVFNRLSFLTIGSHLETDTRSKWLSLQEGSPRLEKRWTCSRTTNKSEIWRTKKWKCETSYCFWWANGLSLKNRHSLPVPTPQTV